VILDGIMYGGDATEGDLDATYFNPVASTIPKLRAFKLLRWMQWKYADSYFKNFFLYVVSLSSLNLIKLLEQTPNTRPIYQKGFDAFTEAKMWTVIFWVTTHL
jgi:hypothetical protein